jgi:glutamate-1-semialdehyde 2,1-aminomutase
MTATQTILDRFVAEHATSERLAAEARAVFPGGVTHDARYLAPFPLVIDHARGARKWDVDGNELIDYVMGHGAMLLGHLHPAVESALSEQVHRFTHAGGSTREEVAWGRAVQRLIPSAERVRFTSSGTEATQMAVRLARAYSGRDKIVRFDQHFHGWNDALTLASEASGERPTSPGLPLEVLRQQIVLRQNDIAALGTVLAERGNEIAAVILEPTGAHGGAHPAERSWVEATRELTTKAGVLLIFDEVVTGFRASAGGLQARWGITPDLTTLAKILAGGLPGGAVVGRADLLDQISFDGEAPAGRVAHPGTFNANPLSSAAGAACLEVVATGEPNAAADRAALRLASACNDVFARRKARGVVFGFASMLHVMVGGNVALPDDGITFAWGDADRTRIPRGDMAAMQQFHRALLNEGVDYMPSGWVMVSAAHSDSDIDETARAFDRAVGAMQAEGLM